MDALAFMERETRPGKVRLRVLFLPGACAVVDEDVALQCRVRQDEVLVIGKVLEVMEQQWRKEHPEAWAAEVALKNEGRGGVGMQNEK
jgi:hypothetical protein